MLGERRAESNRDAMELPEIDDRCTETLVGDHNLMVINRLIEMG